MQIQTLNRKAAAWANVNLPPDVERRAAAAAIEFLREVLDRVEVTLERGTEEAARSLHWVKDFGAISPEFLDFFIATLGSGEVRISFHDGLVKMEETGIPALWRVQNGDQQSFVLALVPPSVVAMAGRGEETFDWDLSDTTDVFAAPAILEQLRAAVKTNDVSRLIDEPPYLIELSREPLAPQDRRFLTSVLGAGDIDIQLTGYANARIRSTKVRGIWHSQLASNAGATLMDAYVVALLPPEVPASPEELTTTRDRVKEAIDWLEADIERGAFGKDE